MKITDKISLRPLQVDDANDMYNTIDAQREYLGQWLPFVAGTTSVAVTKAFVDSAVDADDKTYTPLSPEQSHICFFRSMSGGCEMGCDFTKRFLPQHGN